MTGLVRPGAHPARPDLRSGDPAVNRIIPPAEIKKGDVLTLTFTAGLDAAPEGVFSDGRRYHAIYGTVCGAEQGIYLPPDTTVTVDRPDPDAELIRRIADAIAESDRQGGGYLHNAHAALAVMRAAK